MCKMSLVVSCGDPGIPDNGVRYGDTFTYQSRVVMECEPQYRLVGDQIRTCQADGTWSGTQPICERKYSYNICWILRAVASFS